MSYCRWSSNDHQSDAYVWADVDGTWHTEIAALRRIWTVPLPDPIPDPPRRSDDDLRDWAAENISRDLRVHQMLNDPDTGRWTEIPEPAGGRSYRHATPGECAANLERLAAVGIRVPAEAIAALRAEDADLMEGLRR